jgi:hypothetical protein
VPPRSPPLVGLVRALHDLPPGPRGLLAVSAAGPAEMLTSTTRAAGAPRAGASTTVEPRLAGAPAGGRCRRPVRQPGRQPVRPQPADHAPLPGSGRRASSHVHTRARPPPSPCGQPLVRSDRRCYVAPTTPLGGEPGMDGAPRNPAIDVRSTASGQFPATWRQVRVESSTSVGSLWIDHRIRTKGYQVRERARSASEP